MFSRVISLRAADSERNSLLNSLLPGNFFPVHAELSIRPRQAAEAPACGQRSMLEKHASGSRPRAETCRLALSRRTCRLGRSDPLCVPLSQKPERRIEAFIPLDRLRMGPTKLRLLPLPLFPAR